MKIICAILLVTCAVNVIFVFGEQCSDCMPVANCPNAVKLLNDKSPTAHNELRNAFCGFKYNLPRVCCSKLQVTPSLTSNKNLDQHPNLNLLPMNCGNIGTNRIYGGTEANLYEFPWMALISYRTADGLAFNCAGSVINNRYILTAAHCIKNLKIAGVRIGEHDTRTDVDCQGSAQNIVCESKLQDIRVEEEIYHEGYTRTPIVHDIGLLRLKKPIDFSYKNADPICLPLTSQFREQDVGGVNATVAGWGYTESGETSPVLLATIVSIYTKEACSTLYNRGASDDVDKTDGKLCAGGEGKDSCGGDSGGPLLAEGKFNGKDRYIQRGIVSYGPRLCASNYPGVYTDVTKYMDWILDHIKP